MNIGIVTTWFERGAAYVSRQFMEVLQETDKVYIYARGGESYAKNNPKWDLNNVHWGEWNKSKRIAIDSTYINKKDFVKWLRQNNIEAVLFNEQHWFLPVLWCKECGIKTIAYVDYYTETTIPFFEVYDCLICNTKRHAFAFRNHSNCNYIKWGTDIELYKPSTITNEKLVFFHSAGMAPIRKGTDLLITSFYNCKERQKAKLLIHTQLSLTKEIPTVAKQIEELLSEGSLEIVEKTIPAPGLYEKGDIYVYPSRLDGIGLTLMEAIASGMAIVTINNAPMNEFVESSFGQFCEVEYYYSRSDGYYWPMSVASTSSLTGILENYISNKYDLRSLKENARCYAEKELNFKNNCRSLHNIIEQTTLIPINTNLVNKITKYGGGNYERYINIYSYLYISRMFFKEVLGKTFKWLAK